MESLLTTEPVGSAPPPRRGIPAIVLLVALPALLVAVWFFWPAQRVAAPELATKSRLALGPAEQAYAAKIELGSPELTRSENFLHQEVYTLSGELHNTGEQTVAALELTLQLSDQLHQIVLRESRAIVENSGAPLNPGERRPYEISIEHIPSSWNMEQPDVHITGLALAARQH
jgi:hypothetical protein